MAGEFLLGLEVNEVLTEFFGGDRFGRFVEELAELADTGPVAKDRALGQGQQAQIVVEAI